MPTIHLDNRVWSVGVSMKNRVGMVFCLLLCMLLISGCATTVKTSETIPGELTEYITPELRVVSKAFIGDTVVKEWKTLTTDALLLSSNFGLIRITAHHPKGEYLLIGKQDDVRVYQHEKTYFDGWVTRKSQLLEAPDGTVYRKIYSGTKEVPSNKYSKDLVITDASAPIEQRLIFTGSEGDVLTFTYCEFLGDKNRPAFAVDATYDISKDNIIRFKNLLLQVIACDNQGITYTVLSGFKD